MENKHTPEPWRVGCDKEAICTEYRDHNGNMTQDNWTKNGFAKTIVRSKPMSWMRQGENADNLNRIVLCVNACKNLENEELQDLIGLGGLQLEAHNHVVAENAALREKLERVREYCEYREKVSPVARGVIAAINEGVKG